MIAYLARTTIYNRLAAPAGINSLFTGLCEANNFPIPTPAGGDEATPFNFGPSSSNVFIGRAEIDHLMSWGLVQYPVLMIGSTTIKQTPTKNRITPSQFWGTVNIRLSVWFGYFFQQPPPGNDFDSHVDFFEAALYACLNDGTVWWPPGLVWDAEINEPQREQAKMVNLNQDIRTGVHFDLTMRMGQYT